MPPKTNKNELSIRERQAIEVFIRSGGSYQTVAEEVEGYSSRQHVYSSLQRQPIKDEIRRALNALALSPERLLAYGVEALGAMRPYCLTDAGDDVVNVPDWPTRYKFWHDLCKVCKVTQAKPQDRDSGRRFTIYFPDASDGKQAAIIETTEGDGGVLVAVKGARAPQPVGPGGAGDLLPSAPPGDCEIIHKGAGVASAPKLVKEFTKDDCE